MVPNLIRLQESGNLHFITFSCFQRRPYLAEPETRQLFEASLEKARITYDFYLNAYVVMPNHVHLLISEPKNAILAKAIQALKISVSRQQEERPLWQHRYHDFNVYSPQKFTEKLKYIHRNPVTRGLVANPEDWPSSSFRHYATGHPGTVEIESSWLASARLTTNPGAPDLPLRRSGKSTQPTAAP
jgi:putative transposase